MSEQAPSQTNPTPAEVRHSEAGTAEQIGRIAKMAGNRIVARAVEEGTDFLDSSYQVITTESGDLLHTKTTPDGAVNLAREDSGLKTAGNIATDKRFKPGDKGQSIEVSTKGGVAKGEYRTDILGQDRGVVRRVQKLNGNQVRGAAANILGTVRSNIAAKEVRQVDEFIKK